MDHFQLATANKSQETQYPNLSLSAVNALALVRDMSWEDAYRLLLKQGQRYGLLLKNKICIVNMLADAGYVRIPGFRCLKDYTELNSLLTDQYPQITHALAVTRRGKPRYDRYCAVRRLPEAGTGFVAMDLTEEEREIFGLWVHHSEISVPKPVPAKPEMQQDMFIPAHRGYVYFQPNPLKNRTGDCVIRAYSAVFNRSWNQILEMLAKSCEYKDTALNSRFVFQSLASEYELDPYDRMLEDGVGLTGIEFCDRMTLRCRNGERFFALVGNNHVVGIIPAEIDGERQYAIADSWDSSHLKIGRYWVFRPKKRLQQKAKRPPAPSLPSLRAGDCLVHPVFGAGTVQEVQEADQRVRIDFPRDGEKWMTVSWVMMHCRPAS